MLSQKLSLFVAMLSLVVASSAYAADKRSTAFWILLEFNEEKIEVRAPTIRFTEKGVDRSTGVNCFFGKYAVDSENPFGNESSACDT